VNNVLQEQMTNYLKDEGFEYLGQPIPSKDQEQFDFNLSSLGDFEFLFDIGLAPSFEVVGASEDTKLSRYKIEIPEKTINEELEVARKRSGTESFPEDNIQEDDIITLHAQELEGIGCPRYSKPSSFK